MAYTTAGLTNGGRTTHYQIQYDDSLSPADGMNRANALIAVCEQDYALVSGWTHTSPAPPLSPAPTRITLTGDFDKDGAAEVFVSSPRGVGVLKLAGNTMDALMLQPNGTRFGGWLLNTADNTV